jgi:hypothetical protein
LGLQLGNTGAVGLAIGPFALLPEVHEETAQCR